MLRYPGSSSIITVRENALNFPAPIAVTASYGFSVRPSISSPPILAITAHVDTAIAIVPAAAPSPHINVATSASISTGIVLTHCTITLTTILTYDFLIRLPAYKNAVKSPNTAPINVPAIDICTVLISGSITLPQYPVSGGNILFMNNTA